MWTIQTAAEQIRHGRLSPVDLLESCLECIARQEPLVRAWVFVDRDRARAEAAERAAEVKHGHWRGPLHGIPLGIKDIIDVFDWPTAAGSKLWKQSIARQDAEVVRKLRAAGAILIGKTVTTQYASFDPPPTRNPWRLDVTPGGSSSGSAAATATGMCLAALGSQTGGSICRPAAFCGVVGFKPSFGRLSCEGVLPLAHSLDHPGTLSRCVLDAAILFEAMTDADPPNAASSICPDNGVRMSPRLGRLRGLFVERAEPVMADHIDRVCATLAEKGLTIEDVDLPASFAEVERRHRLVMAVEAAAYHEYRLRRHPEDYDPNITALLREGLACSALAYAQTKQHQKSLTAEMASCFQGVDVLLTPTTNGPAPSAATTGDPVFNSPWSYTGLPSLCLPSGLSADGLPLSIQLIGAKGDEAKLFAAALACEAALGVELGEPPVLG